MRRVVSTLCVVVFVLSGTAFGWGPFQHGKLATKVLNNSWVSPSVYAAGLNPSTVAGRSWEADLPQNETWEHPQWEEMSTRGYVFSSKWGQINEETRLAFMLHVTSDDGVPTGHTPAVTYWNKYQDILEARADSWTNTTPNITSYYTGTIGNQCSQFYTECTNNAIWGNANVTSNWEATFGNHGSDVIWNGLSCGQKLGVAVALDYFRAKLPTVAEANGGYSVSPGGSIQFSSANSYDPDAVSTNANGSASQTWTGLTRDWDLNLDGIYETYGASPTLTYDQLMAMGLGVGQHTVRLRCQDNEGSTYLDQYNNGGVSYDTASLYIYGGGLMAAAVPEPSSIVMLLAMAISLGFWKIRRNGRV